MRIKGKMTKVKVICLKNLARLRTSKEVELILVLSAEIFVPLVRCEVVDLLEILDYRGEVTLVEGMYLCAVSAITYTLDRVGEKTDDALHVDKWDIELQDTQNLSGLVMGTLNVLGYFARVLIDCDVEILCY